MRIHLKITLLITVLLSIFAGSKSANAKEKRYTIKVYGMDNKITKGTLESVDEQGVYVFQKVGIAPVFINALQIKEIKLRKKGKAGIGTTIGFITGLAIGTAAVLTLQNDDKLENTLHIVGGGLFTFLSTAIGGAIGSKYSESFLIQGRTEDYLQTLQKLKSFTPAVNSK
ncbi:MAG: hypothetical protein H7Y07_07815 [Pyrinomonadaceae bacterium]|nr:hypothetical protein [Sphingobacteriaceae bacterium]